MPPIQRRPEPPQRATPARKTDSGHKPVASSRTRTREESLNDWGRLGTLYCIFRGLYADAGAIAEHGPKFTHELALMGETNEFIAKLLDYATEAGPVMGAVAVGLPLGLQFLANHGKIDATKLPPESGIVPPKILEERVKADMELANARILAEINQIRQQAQEAMREAGVTA